MRWADNFSIGPTLTSSENGIGFSARINVFQYRWILASIGGRSRGNGNGWVAIIIIYLVSIYQSAHAIASNTQVCAFSPISIGGGKKLGVYP